MKVCRGASWLLLGSVVVIGAACAEEPEAFSPSYDGSPIETDALEYQLTYWPDDDFGLYDAEAIATYVNLSDAPVYFERCYPEDAVPIHGLVRAPPDDGRSVVGWAWGCVGGVAPGVLESGESLVVPVWLGSTESPDAEPPITMEMRTGLFRIEFRLISSEGAPLPDEQRRSNTFVISPPP